MTVTLSCDHRVIDGATGARFLAGLQTVHRRTGSDVAVVVPGMDDLDAITETAGAAAVEIAALPPRARRQGWAVPQLRRRR